MIITLSRQLGSLGDAIAAQVVAALGLTLIDRERVRQEALAAGMDATLFPRLTADEPRSLATEMIEGLSSVPTRRGPAPNPLGAIFAPLVQPASIGLEEGERQIGVVIRQMAARGDALILGQAGQILLRDQPTALHVQTVAPFDLRVKRIAEREQRTLAAARRRVRTSDQARAEYLARYHAVDWMDPLFYHLVINTGLLSVDDTVAVIVGLAHRISCR